jgi:hypothetical protein
LDAASNTSTALFPFPNATVASLNDSTSYSFRAFAVNKWGKGEPGAEWSFSTVVGPPEPMASVQIVILEATRIQVCCRTRVSGWRCTRGLVQGVALRVEQS